MRQNLEHDLWLLSQLSERNGMGVNQFRERAKKGPSGARIGAPLTVQRWLDYAGKQGWVRIEGGSRLGLGHKASIRRTSDGTMKIGEKPPKENQCGELDVLKTGGFHVSVNQSKNMFMYSQSTANPRRYKRITELEHELVSIVEELHGIYKSRLENIIYERHGLSKSDWDEKHQARYEFLVRRMNYEIYEIFKRDSRSYGAEIKRKRNRWRKTYARPEVEALAAQFGVHPWELTDELAEKQLRSIPLSDGEHKEFLGLCEVKHKVAVANQEIEQTLGAFAVLAGNYEFTEQLLLPPGHLIRTVGHEYERKYVNVDDFVRRLPSKQIVRYENTFWEAAFTRKYSRDVWFNSVDENGEAIGGTEITHAHLGVEIGLDFPNTFVEVPVLQTQTMRHAYFVKLHAAFSGELRRRGLKELKHDRRASIQDFIDPLETKHPGLKRVMNYPIARRDQFEHA